MVNVKLQTFEGPLALLLYLIRKEEMDIFDIDIHEITSQYLNYIKAMKKFDLEVAGEFIAMAATLIQIKSKMLLPIDENEEQEGVEDPRQVLVERLLEYEKFKKMAQVLNEGTLLKRDVFSRGKKDIHLLRTEGDLVVDEEGLLGLMKCYMKALRRVKRKVHQVVVDLETIGARILKLKNLLKVGERQSFRDFISENKGEPQRNQVLVTFLSFLELSKLGFVNLFQVNVDSDIYVQSKKPISDDIIHGIETYQNVETSEVRG